MLLHCMRWHPESRRPGAAFLAPFRLALFCQRHRQPSWVISLAARSRLSCMHTRLLVTWVISSCRGRSLRYWLGAGCLTSSLSCPSNITILCCMLQYGQSLTVASAQGWFYLQRNLCLNTVISLFVLCCCFRADGAVPCLLCVCCLALLH